MRKGTMSPAVAFNVLNAARKARREQKCKFGVYFIRKDGEPYAKPTGTHVEQSDAERQADYLRQVNPGKEVIVLPL